MGNKRVVSLSHELLKGVSYLLEQEKGLLRSKPTRMRKEP